MGNTLAIGVLVVVCTCATAVRVDAQAPADGRWQVEFHGGSSMTGGVGSGTAIGEFPVGSPLSSGFWTESRAVSSWYFGDGARLLNEVNAVFGVAATMTPLDAALTSVPIRHQTGAAFGVRVSRDLTPRISPELSVGYARTALTFTDSAIASIEAARSSFIPAWTGLLETGPTTDRKVTSTSEIERGSGHEISVTGGLKVRLRRAGRLMPYVSAGAGALFHRGTAPSATLKGDYGFRVAGFFPLNERDAVTLRVQNKDTRFICVLGGGFEYAVSRRTGIRGDLRVHLSENSVATLVSATPSVVTQGPAFAISTGTRPSIQFSNEPSNWPSSLSGPAVADLRTFSGTGMQALTNISVGYFVRF
jgi:hypothetical protein